MTNNTHRIENNAPHGYINEENDVWTDEDPRIGFEGTDPQEYAYPWRAATEAERQKSHPEVDDLATMSINGDSYVVRITKVTPKTITATNTVKQTDGTYADAPEERIMSFRWSEKRQGFLYSQYFRLTLGKAVERRDPSF